MTSTARFDIDVREQLAKLRSSSSDVEPFAWFQRMWGVAVIAHVVGNARVGQVLPDPTLLGFASLLTGAVAIAAIVLRFDRRLLLSLSGLVIVTAALEAPMLSNHWLLASFVSVALIIALLSSDSWSIFATTGRSIHLVFYFFAAFAKLNSSFFDPTVSCAVLFANRSLSASGLPVLDSGSVAAMSLPYVTAGVELAIPLLLLTRRTRAVGVGLGVVFHGLVSLDLDQHLYDFTAVLLPLFLLWLPDSTPGQLGRPLRRRLQLGLTGLLAVFVGATVIPRTRLTATLLEEAFFILWIPLVVALIVWSIRHARHVEEVQATLTSPFTWLVVLLVFSNGLTPYLEVKTANSWNMYSNLSITEGDSNHLLVRSGIPASNAMSNPIEILMTDDPGLSRYIDSGYLLPRRNFYEYLAAHPGVEVVFSQAGLVQSAIGNQLGRASPFWIEKFVVLRAIDTSDPIRCDPVWLPAR